MNEKKKISRNFNNQYPTRNIQVSSKKAGKKSFRRKRETKNSNEKYNKIDGADGNK